MGDRVPHWRPCVHSPRAEEPTMARPASAGARFRAALAAESPLQVIGAINANHALLAQRAGYRAIYL